MVPRHKVVDSFHNVFGVPRFKRKIRNRRERRSDDRDIIAVLFECLFLSTMSHRELLFFGSITHSLVVAKVAGKLCCEMHLSDVISKRS